MQSMEPWATYIHGMRRQSCMNALQLLAVQLLPHVSIATLLDAINVICLEL